MLKEAPKPERVEKKRKKQEENEDVKGREGNTSNLQQPSLLRTMRLTTPPILVIMTNENGGGKDIE